MNIHKSTYKKLEEGCIDLMYSLHFCDDNADACSLRIANLIIDSVVEIESLSKAMYRKRHGSFDEKKFKFDSDFIDLLTDQYKLQKRKVIIVSPNSFFESLKAIKPFEKTVARRNKKGEITGYTYLWNEAYQHLKHDKAQSLLRFGTLRCLLQSMATLYVLHVIDTFEQVNIDDAGQPPSELYSIGSEIFAVKICNPFFGRGLDFDHPEKLKLRDIKHSVDEFLFLVAPEDFSLIGLQEVLEDMAESITKSCNWHFENTPEIRCSGIYDMRDWISLEGCLNLRNENDWNELVLKAFEKSTDMNHKTSINKMEFKQMINKF